MRDQVRARTRNTRVRTKSVRAIQIEEEAIRQLAQMYGADEEETLVGVAVACK